ASHGSDAPTDHEAGTAQSRTASVDKSADGEHANRVSRLKRNYDVAVIDLAPTEMVLQGGLQRRENPAIHIVLCCAEKQEATNHPAKIAWARASLWQGRFTRCRSSSLRR